MAGRRAGTLLPLMERIERFTLARAWTGLVDDELVWSPAVPTWGIHRRADCETPTPFGDGEWVADFDDQVARTAHPPDEIEPIATIGWLWWHIGSAPGRLVETEVFGGPHRVASGWTSPYLAHYPVFSRASDATEALRDGWHALRTAVEAATDDQLETPVAGYTYAPEPPRGGLFVVGPPGPERPAHDHVSGMLNEISHHGAQICVLRDLYRWTASRS